MRTGGGEREAQEARGGGGLASSGDGPDGKVRMEMRSPGRTGNAVIFCSTSEVEEEGERRDDDNPFDRGAAPASWLGWRGSDTQDAVTSATGHRTHPHPPSVVPLLLSRFPSFSVPDDGGGVLPIGVGTPLGWLDTEAAPHVTVSSSIRCGDAAGDEEKEQVDVPSSISSWVKEFSRQTNRYTCG